MSNMLDKKESESVENKKKEPQPFELEKVKRLIRLNLEKNNIKIELKYLRT